MSLTNGHVSGADAGRPKPSPQPRRSESELSDVNDLPSAPRAEADDQPRPEEDAMHDMATSELDDEEDAPGEEDADFKAETPPPERSDGMRHDRSLSEDSLRPGKRKAGVDDEEHMKQNPELYGLRRSVSIPWFLSHFARTHNISQGRARPNRRVVRACWCKCRMISD